MIHIPEIKKDNKQQSPVYTRDTIMEMFSISKTTLHRWITMYGCPYHKVNRRVFSGQMSSILGSILTKFNRRIKMTNLSISTPT